MGLDELIGLEAIFKTAEFTNGLKTYLDGVQEAKGQTKSASNQITAGLATIGGAAVAGGIAAVGAGVAALGGLLVSSAGPASDLAESLNAVGVVFGEGAEQIQAYGETAYKTVGLSNRQFNQLATVTGAFLQNVGFDAKGAGEETIRLAERASDMASVFNTDVTTALEAIQSGLKGEFNPLEQFGVKLNAAAIEARALEMGLADSASELTDSAKAAAALELIYEQTAKTQGDFANTSDSAANAQKILGAQIENIRAQIGAAVIPVWQQFQQALLNVFANPSFQAGLQSFIAGIGAIATTVISHFPAVIEGIRNVFNFLAENQPLVVGALAAITAAMAAWAYTTITAAIPTLTLFIATMGPAILVMLAIGAVVAALGYAWQNNFLGMRDTITAFWETSVKPALEALWAWLSITIPAAIEVLKGFWENTLLPAIQAVWSWIQANLFPLFQLLFEWLSVTVPAAIQVLTDFWSTVLLPAIQAVWGFIQNDLVPLFQALADLLSAVVGLAVRVLAGLWQNVLKPALEAVWAFIQSSVLPIFKSLADYLNDKFGPAVEFVRRLVDGLKATFENVRNAIRDVIDWVKRLTDKLNAVQLPDWLTPGSPTPFEIGLVGIGDALHQLSQFELPALQARLNTMAAPMSAPSTAATPSMINNKTVSIVNHFGGNTLTGGLDLAAYEAYENRQLASQMATF